MGMEQGRKDSFVFRNLFRTFFHTLFRNLFREDHQVVWPPLFDARLC
jgi:hypothetical protein